MALEDNPTVRAISVTAAVVLLAAGAMQFAYIIKFMRQEKEDTRRRLERLENEE